METGDIPESLEDTAEEYSGLYTLFQDKGDKAVDIFHWADPEDYHLPLPEEVYEEVEDQGRTPPLMQQGEFESIVNFLSRADILPTWNDSSPFRILMEDVDEQLIATAYEEASGEQYNFPETNTSEETSNLPDYLRS